MRYLKNLLNVVMTFKMKIVKRAYCQYVFILTASSLLLIACDTEQITPPAETGIEIESHNKKAPAYGRKNVVEVTSTGMNFNLPDKIPSGWTTFRYNNKTGMTHFFVVEKMPLYKGDQKTVEDSKAEVVPAFQAIMDAIIAGEALPLGMLPEWYPLVEFVGGPGLIAPGGTAVTTIHLDPGTYVIECYVKAPDGTFHSTRGMIEGFVVTEEVSNAPPPKPTLKMTLSSEDGIEVDGKIRPGKHIVEVYYEDQQIQEHFLGFDVHLVKIEENTDLNEVASWMNWSARDGLTIKAPAEFLGGAQEMPGGSTAYITVHLKPGTYAWISEVPDPASKGMLKTFTVPYGRRTSR